MLSEEDEEEEKEDDSDDREIDEKSLHEDLCSGNTGKLKPRIASSDSLLKSMPLQQKLLLDQSPLRV